MTWLATVGILLFPPFPLPEPAPPPAAVAPSEPDAVVLNAVGDVAYPNGWKGIDQIDQKKEHLFDQVRSLLDAADLNFANIECPLTNVVPRVKKTYPISCDPKRLAYIVDAGFNLFSLANNHALDCGPEGFADTQSLFTKTTTKERPIYWAGAANGPIELSVKGQTIALFAVANGSGGGLVDSLQSPTLEQRIADAGKTHDIVLVSVHNGLEYHHVPEGGIVTRYHQLIDAGADVVIGHHPHVVQGVERYKNGVIFYSLGNFSFGSKTVRHHETGARMYSMIAHLVFRAGHVSEAMIVPLYANNSEAWTVEGQTLQPIHATPQLLHGVFAKAALREFLEFTADIPGAAPTRLQVDGDVAKIQIP